MYTFLRCISIVFFREIPARRNRRPPRETSQGDAAPGTPGRIRKASLYSRFTGRQDIPDTVVETVLKGYADHSIFVRADWDDPVNRGHCGVSLGDGKLIHAWDTVRIDGYREIEAMTALSGDRPKYIGRAPVERVLRQKP